jgi:type II secretory pathway component GspD/PulD (secretin)
VPEQISNTLLISATPRYFKEIQELVVNLDSPPQQVTIQALLVEVTLDNTDEFGVELGLQDSVLFRRSVVDQLTTLQTTNTAPNGVQTSTQNIISQTAIPGFLFNNQQLGNNTTVAPGIVGKQSLTSFSLGRQNQELGYGGLVLAAGSESVSVLLRALAATRRVDVLSRPQIRTLDNQLGIIQVGQEVPVVNGFANSAVGAVNPTVEIRQAGIILQVVPRISPDGRVVMDVAAERSTYLPEDQGVVIFSDAASGRTIRAPKKDISTARASVAVSNEQTVVLGGMISVNNTSIQRKVPIIGDLPFLGLPFRYNFSQNVKKELLIFLTPRVIKTDADSEYIKQIETARIHFMESDAEEIHGPIMAAPAPVDPGIVTPPIVPPAVDDPSVPTTEVQPELQAPIPPPPPPDGELKLMRRGSIRKSTTPVAMRK